MNKQKKNLWERLLNLLGWTVLHPTAHPPKSIICVAPHTSNWDFFLGYLYYLSIGRAKPNFMIKKEWFVFPFNYILKWLGGVPINRSKSGSVVDSVVKKIKERKHFYLGITPEGTRSYTERWKTGFYRIAQGAKIPLEIAKIDYGKKEVGIITCYTPLDLTLEEEIRQIRSYYTKDMARYPERFNDINMP